MRFSTGTAGFARNDGARDELAEAHYIAPEIYQRDDVAERQAKLARIVSAQIAPRLVRLHGEILAPAVEDGQHPGESEIAHLAHLVLGPELVPAADYVTRLRDRGLSMEMLFVELLEPAARHLGTMWERDECDFVDVTLGLGRLQKLLAVFNCTYTIPALNEKRRVLTTATPGEEHFFGLTMVNKFLNAGGWTVDTTIGATPGEIIELARERWYAVAGLTLGSEQNLGALKAIVAEIRRHSRNPTIGIMVGGPVFSDDPQRAIEVGADAMAVNAPAAVVVAQKLFDIGALKRWMAADPAA